MHPYYTTNFADREMFAYNANFDREAFEKQQEEKKTAKQKLEAHLAQPETRIKYAFEFLKDFGFDSEDDYAEEIRTKCYNGIAKYSDKLDWSEAHY